MSKLSFQDEMRRMVEQVLKETKMEDLNAGSVTNALLNSIKSDEVKWALMRLLTRLDSRFDKYDID